MSANINIQWEVDSDTEYNSDAQADKALEEAKATALTEKDTVVLPMKTTPLLSKKNTSNNNNYESARQQSDTTTTKTTKNSKRTTNVLRVVALVAILVFTVWASTKVDFKSLSLRTDTAILSTNGDVVVSGDITMTFPPSTSPTLRSSRVDVNREERKRLRKESAERRQQAVDNVYKDVLLEEGRQVRNKFEEFIPNVDGVSAYRTVLPPMCRTTNTFQSDEFLSDYIVTSRDENGFQNIRLLFWDTNLYINLTVVVRAKDDEKSHLNDQSVVLKVLESQLSKGLTMKDIMIEGLSQKSNNDDNSPKREEKDDDRLVDFMVGFRDTWEEKCRPKTQASDPKQEWEDQEKEFERQEELLAKGNDGPCGVLNLQLILPSKIQSPTIVVHGKVLNIHFDESVSSTKFHFVGVFTEHGNITVSESGISVDKLRLYTTTGSISVPNIVFGEWSRQQQYEHLSKGSMGSKMATGYGDIYVGLKVIPPQYLLLNGESDKGRIRFIVPDITNDNSKTHEETIFFLKTMSIIVTTTTTSTIMNELDVTLVAMNDQGQGRIVKKDGTDEVFEYRRSFLSKHAKVVEDNAAENVTGIRSEGNEYELGFSERQPPMAYMQEFRRRVMFISNGPYVDAVTVVLV